MGDTTRINLNETKTDNAVDEAVAAKQRMEQLKTDRSRIFASADGASPVSSEETSISQNELANVDLNDQSAITEIMQKNSSTKSDVSALTVGRMLGLVTSAEFQLLQSKLDLLSSRINNALTKLDKVNQSMANIPTGSDLERIDVQLGALRDSLQDYFKGAGKSVNGSAAVSVSSTKILSND